ncbi:hypothetical protein V493_03664 [Pseudogymnoascus sp. VKM F-4281 (FW-2241)]|nr:hypothetical protein V493_03664 [Pseudogymnoascus sp. VKM F-4281 (FW-2241)]
MAFLESLLRSVGLRQRSTDEAGEDSGSFLPQDEKNHNQLQARKESSPLLLPTKKEPRAKSKSNKIDSEKYYLKQVAANARRTEAAMRRTPVAMESFTVAAERTAKLLELTVAKEGLKIEEETHLPFLPRKERETHNKFRFKTKTELYQMVVDSTKGAAVSAENMAITWERAAVAKERTAKLLELVVARGEELELLNGVFYSSKGWASKNKSVNVVVERLGEVEFS